MYTRQQASMVQKKFWTVFGQYMRPVKGMEGETINWLNYKTGTRHLYFRMDVQATGASVAIELRHADAGMREHYYTQLKSLKNLLEQSTAEEWDWQAELKDEDGRMISRVSKGLPGVNIYNENDWPAIISFLKHRITGLDQFWMAVKDVFE